MKTRTFPRGSVRVFLFLEVILEIVKAELLRFSILGNLESLRLVLHPASQSLYTKSGLLTINNILSHLYVDLNELKALAVHTYQNEIFNSIPEDRFLNATNWAALLKFVLSRFVKLDVEIGVELYERGFNPLAKVDFENLTGIVTKSSNNTEQKVYFTQALELLRTLRGMYVETSRPELKILVESLRSDFITFCHTYFQPATNIELFGEVPQFFTE